MLRCRECGSLRGPCEICGHPEGFQHFTIASDTRSWWLCSECSRDYPDWRPPVNWWACYHRETGRRWAIMTQSKEKPVQYSRHHGWEIAGPFKTQTKAIRILGIDPQQYFELQYEGCERPWEKEELSDGWPKFLDPEGGD